MSSQRAQPGPTRVRVDRVGDRHELRAKIRPLFEQVELVRTRPPVRRWRQQSSARLPLPDPYTTRASAKRWGRRG